MGYCDRCLQEEVDYRRSEISIDPPPSPMKPESESPLQPKEEPEEPPKSNAIDVQGWRRVVLVATVLMGLFLGFLDTTIVSVALPSIANQFQNFSDSSWVVSSYLLTYMGKFGSWTGMEHLN